MHAFIVFYGGIGSIPREILCTLVYLCIVRMGYTEHGNNFLEHIVITSIQLVFSHLNPTRKYLCMYICSYSWTIVVGDGYKSWFIVLDHTVRYGAYHSKINGIGIGTYIGCPVVQYGMVSCHAELDCTNKGGLEREEEREKEREEK